MADSPCSGGDAVLQAENAAIEMYRFAALMLGSEAEALRLVEKTVSTFEIDPCANPSAVKGIAQERVLAGALEIMHRQDPESFEQIPAAEAGLGCLQEEPASPLSTAQISELVAGAGSSGLRDWLNHLSQAQRAVFVQRAVLGQDNAATASAINRFARPAVWTADGVGRLFRQALCSLASSLLQAASPVHV